MAVTTIATPVTDQLIETAWGINVADTVNDHTNNKLSRAGGTLTGLVTANAGIALGGSQPTAANMATPKNYVDIQRDTRVATTGDSMTGALQINRTGTNLCLRLTATTAGPYIDFTHVAGSPVYGYIQGGSTGMTIRSIGDIEVHPSNALAGSFSSTLFLWGKPTSDPATAGFELLGAASTATGMMRTTMNEAGNPNLYIRRETAGVTAGASFVQFLKNKAPGLAVIGSVSIVGDSGTGVAYNTTSDYRLKNDLGPLTGALDQVLALTPRRLEFKSEPGVEFVGFYAHEVDAVAPYAVQGEKDAEYTTEETDASGMEPGSIKPQQLDQSRLVALLTGAVQELAGRVDVLEAAV